MRHIVDDLADDGDDRGQQRRVEELERETEIPVRIPRQIREVIDDEPRVGDEGRLDAAAELRELAREEWSDRPRLQSEESDDYEEINGNPAR